MNFFPRFRTRIRSFATLCGLTFAALLVHGYHPCAEDAAIYIPGVKKLLHPALYPFGSEFFLSHARMTFFAQFVAGSLRLLHLAVHLGVEPGLFVLYLLSILFLLTACWSLSRHLFAGDAARWTGVALVAAVLTVPAAGTSLLLADPYLTPRSFSTPAVLFALSAVLGRRYFAAALWLVFAAVFHPLMVIFGLAFCGSLRLFQSGLPGRVWLWSRERSRTPQPAAVQWFLAPAALPLFSLALQPAAGPYLEALHTRAYFFVTNWTWYEWVGVFAPLLILAVVARFAPLQSLPSLRCLCYSSIFCGILFTASALLLSSSARFDRVAELQPMRAFHTLYLLFFLVLGTLLGAALGRKPIRCLVLFVPVCLTMFLVQRTTFPGNRHVEWPGLAPANRWLQSFAWIRKNTPESAVFALNPDHMHLLDEDNEGFRALAERSMLADASKDTGVVSMFPALAQTWKDQVAAQHNWERFQRSDFETLARTFGVSWVVLDTPNATDLDCPYKNGFIRVCRIARMPRPPATRQDLQ